MSSRRLLDYGAAAALVECPDLADALALHRRLRAEPLAPVTELVPGARTVLLRLDRPLTPGEREHLVHVPGLHVELVEAAPVEIEVDYTGADLTEVAALTGLTPAEVVAAHTGQTWTVAFCGFAPGFAYLHGEDEALRVPRRTSPRTRVPAGAVGLADQWSGVYPREGPGGWQLIGRTDRRLWDLEQDPPALLQPGSRLRFRERHRPSDGAGVR